MSQTLSKLPAGKQANVKKREPLFTLNVTGSRLVAGLIAGVIAIGWIFLLGMVAGQMYPGMLSRETADSAQREAIREPAQTSARQEQPNGVIQPEDLEYKQRAGTTTTAGATGATGANRSGGTAHTGGATAPAGGAATGSLGSSNAPTVAAGQIGGATAAGQTTASAPTTNGQTGQAGQANARTGSAGATPAAQTATQAGGQATSQGAAQTTAQTANPDQRFNYIYQIASFKAREQAQALVDKLTKDDVTCQVTQVEANAATWYRVMVNFTGTEAETRNLKNILGKYGISQVIMYAKTPVAGR